jgi:hypothetical protein
MCCIKIIETKVGQDVFVRNTLFAVYLKRSLCLKSPEVTNSKFTDGKELDIIG